MLDSDREDDNMLSNRQEKIIKLLQKHKNGLTCEELSKYIGVSSRTIRSDIKNLILPADEYGIKVHSGTRSGYVLEIINSKLFQFFLQGATVSHTASLEDRVDFIIQKFLQCALKNTSLTQQELADELYISLSTLKLNIKEASKILAPYSLEFASYKTEGMRLIGNEAKLRYFISEYISQKKNPSFLQSNAFYSNVFKGIDLSLIEHIIFRVINAYELHLTDVAVQNLSMHIAIALKRAGQENYIVYTLNQSRFMEKTKEFEVASSIFEELYRATKIDVATSEVYYLTQHLMASKKYMEADDSSIQRMTELVREIISNIKENVNIDFSKDNTLIQWLALHLKTSIPRMKFKMNIRNDVIDIIKSEYPLAFQIAVIASNFLEQKEHIIVNENEIGYIAVHFGAALNRQDIKTDACVRRVLLVCASGMGTAVLLKSRLEEHFKSRIVIVDTIPGYQLTEDMLRTVDIVITTVPIKHIDSEKIIWIKHLLNNKEIYLLEQHYFSLHQGIGIGTEIEDFFRKDCFNMHMQFNTRNEVLEFLTEQLKSKGLMDDLAKHSVFERENASPTEIGNLVAIPHPVYNDPPKSSIAILILDRPILWDEQPVQLVFLISIAKSQFKLWEPIFLKLFNYLVKNNGVKEILHETSYDTFIKNFKKQFPQE